MFKIGGWPDRVKYILKIAPSFSSFLYPSHKPYKPKALQTPSLINSISFRYRVSLKKALKLFLLHLML